MTVTILDPDKTAAAIIGHGTPRNRRSRNAAHYQAERLRALNLLREVEAVYLDDEPNIPSIYGSTSARHVLALPFFLAQGSHVSQDVPRALGVSGSDAPERVNGRTGLLLRAGRHGRSHVPRYPGPGARNRPAI